MSLSDVRSAIAHEETRCGVSSGSTTLIAVSKVQPNDRIEAILAEGHRVFGENRVQEALAKWPPLKEKYPDVALHLIGPLQSNKARQAMQLFDAIHTVDRVKLANRIAMLRDDIGRCPDLFIQVNTGDESQKAGVGVENLDALIKDCRNLDLPVVGLMCIPPQQEEAALHFALLKKLAERNGLSGLSMGMSGDFHKAIAQGATHIRVGSAIFGARLTSAPAQ